ELRAAAFPLHDVASPGGERAQARLPPVVVRVAARTQRLDIGGGPGQVLRVPVEEIAAADRPGAQLGKTLELIGKRVHFAIAREAGGPRPRARMIPPLQQFDAGAPQPLERVVVLLVGRPCRSRAAQRTADALRWVV